VPAVILGGECSSWHAIEGEIVRCELGAAHPPPHAAEVGSPGRPPRLVTWEHNRGRRAAELAAAARRQDRAAEVEEE